MLHLHAQYHVLKDLVERVAHMQVAIGVWRPIMERKRLALRPVGRLPLVELIGASPEVLIAEARLRSRPTPSQKRVQL